jgi:Zn-dependent peptidase ImmA (M78 family)
MTVRRVSHDEEANAFAARLLMPESFVEMFLRDVPDLTDEVIARAADHFQVPEWLATLRLARYWECHKKARTT